MNWAEANVLMALIEGKGVKPHLPAPWAVAMGVYLGMVACFGRSHGLTCWGMSPSSALKAAWLDVHQREPGESG